MAVVVDWNEKCGTATFENHFEGEARTYTLDLYVGNCFLVMVHEFKNADTGKTERELDSFFVDEGHMKRCLDNGVYQRDYCKMTKIRMNKAKCRYYKEIISLLIKTFNDLEIEIYTEGEQTWEEYRKTELTVSDERMREIAEEAISYLYDNDIVEDFLEDRYMDFDDKEREYFGLPEVDDEE